MLNKILSQIADLHIFDIYAEGGCIKRIQWTTSSGNTMMMTEDELKVMGRPIVMLFKTNDVECFALAAYCEEQINDLVATVRCFK
jgi:hypothetical protein